MSLGMIIILYGYGKTGATPPPPETQNRITDGSENRITDNGDQRITD